MNISKEDIAQTVRAALLKLSSEQKRLIIAGNWKMNMTVAQGLDFMRRFKELAPKTRHQLIIFPTATTAYALKDEMAQAGIATGLQNMYWEAKGAFTGEISPEMIQDMGCTYVLIGHSERRQYFGETNEWTNRKVLAAQKNNLIPMLCIGEEKAQRENGSYRQLLEEQLKQGLANADMSRLVVAYEPVWAIGTGLTATTEQIAETLKFIRYVIREQFGTAGVPILYGGSVKPDNLASMVSIEDLNGFLIGGASLKAESYVEMIRLVE